MKSKFFVIAALAALLVSSSASAGDFEFESNLEGDGELEWNFDFTETEDFSELSGATFNFSGGAGTDGEAFANGEFTGVGGVFYEYAGGDGNAYSNTDGSNYAEAQFGSGSLAASAGFAGDLDFGDTEIDFGGLVTAGGAGTVETGLTYGTEYSYSQTGTGSYDYMFNQSGSYED